jgi:hypothetical protein
VACSGSHVEKRLCAREEAVEDVLDERHAALEPEVLPLGLVYTVEERRLETRHTVSGFGH